jgi:hypothetical protein
MHRQLGEIELGRIDELRLGAVRKDERQRGRLSLTLSRAATKENEKKDESGQPLHSSPTVDPRAEVPA